ncbi:hypothetical protein HY17_02840 [Hyphomonas sp. CY54-11-8]|nr:hypothetical protein HY17_02840 [Hyphomonas sp. CY54-11-8]RAN39222.1 hypothetical protein HY26_16430 [Hyphomonas sp. GM-8P]
MADAMPIKLLFVCSHNKWRSPTGEARPHVPPIPNTH